MARKKLESRSTEQADSGKTTSRPEGLQSFQVGQASAQTQIAVEPQEPQEPKRPRGRPGEYSEFIANEILERIADGETLTEICDSEPETYPTRQTFRRWCRNDEKLWSAYVRAREQQAESWSDQIVEIADDSSKDTKTIETQGGSYETVDKEWVERSKIRIESRKWLMARIHSKRWGEKVEQTLHGNLTTKFTLEIGDGSVAKRQQKVEMEIPRAVFDLPKPKSADEIIEENL